MAISKSQVDKAGAIMRAWWDHPTSEVFPKDAGGLIWEYRRQFSYPTTMINANLRYYVMRTNSPVIVAQRLKRLPRIVEKLSRHPRMRLSQMQDIGGCRAILPNQAAVDSVLKGLRRNWDLATTDDYVRAPRATGYRAVHVVARRQGATVEVQLRTIGQQDWADEIERIDSVAKYGLEDGIGPPDVLEYTQRLAEVISHYEAGTAPDELLLTRLNELRRHIP